MELKDVYPAIECAARALTPLYEPALSSSAEEAKIPVRALDILLAIPTFEPNPVDAASLSIRSPYTSPELYDNLLSSLCQKGYLKDIGEHKYHTTREGQQLVTSTLKSIYSAISGIRTLSANDLMDLASRLKELSDACYTSSEPPGKWCILHSRRMDPGAGASAQVRVDQFLSELCAYRDDAHLAAWKGYESDGHAWDILTLLWVEKEFTLHEINNQLQRRGNSLARTTEAVERLTKKGWLVSESDNLRITPFGAEIRKIAEETTDRYYYTPFKYLSDNELERTVSLVEQHRRGIPSF